MRESLRARLEMEANIEVVGESDDAEHALMELEVLDVDVVLIPNPPKDVLGDSP